MSRGGFRAVGWFLVRVLVLALDRWFVVVLVVLVLKLRRVFLLGFAFFFKQGIATSFFFCFDQLFEFGSD